MIGVVGVFFPQRTDFVWRICAVYLLLLFCFDISGSKCDAQFTCNFAKWKDVDPKCVRFVKIQTCPVAVQASKTCPMAIQKTNPPAKKIFSALMSFLFTEFKPFGA